MRAIVNILSRREGLRMSRLGVQGVNAYRAGQEQRAIQAEIERIIPNIIKDAVEMYSIALANVLHDKHGMGKVRVRRILEQVDTVCDGIARGDIDIVDVREAVIEDVGIIIGDDENYKGR